VRSTVICPLGFRDDSSTVPLVSEVLFLRRLVVVVDLVSALLLSERDVVHLQLLDHI